MLRANRSTQRTPSSSHKWKVSIRCESNKLLSTLNVNAPVILSRTRGKNKRNTPASGHDDPVVEETPIKNRKLFASPPLSVATPAPANTPESFSRGIFELQSLRNVICKNFSCPACRKNNQLEVEFPTVCLASSCVITCSDCSFVADSGPLASTNNTTEQQIETSDFQRIETIL